MSETLHQWIAATANGEAAGAPNPAWNQVTTIETLCEAITETLRIDAEKAQRLVHVVQQLAGESSSPRLRGLSARSEAMMHWSANRYAAALDRYEAALVEFERAGDEFETARTRSSAMQTLIYLSRYDEAERWAGAARAVFERHGDRLRLARLDGNRANLLARQDRLVEAVELYERAGRMFATHGAPRDIAALLRNKASCQVGLSRFDDALATHRAARDYCRANGMTGLVAETDYTIANLHYLRGDYLAARTLYDEARRTARAVGDHYHAALCDLDEAELLLDLNLAADARLIARRAQRVFRRLGLLFETAKARVLDALCAAGEVNFDEALRTLAVARSMFVNEGNTRWPPLLDLYRALLLERAESPAAAVRHAQAALQVLSAQVLPGKAVYANLLLARLAMARNDLSLAAAWLAAAQQLLPHAQSPALHGHCHYLAGRLCEARREVSQAIDCYAAAEHEFETLRDRLRSDEMRIAFLHDKNEVYVAHFGLLARRGDIAGAFALVERARAQNMLATIAARRPERAQTERSMQRQRLDHLYHELDVLEVSGEADARQRVPLVRERIRAAELELRAQRQDALPSHAGPWPASLEQVRSALPADATLIEWFESQGRYHAFVIDARGARLHTLGDATEVLRLVRFARFQIERSISSAQTAPAAAATLQAHLRRLHELLLEPLLAAGIHTPHLVLVPHGVLHGLPFHALSDGRGCLGESYSLSLIPSASVLLQVLRERRPEPRSRPAIFGVADAQAPHIATECQQVAQLLPGAALYLNGEATLQRLAAAGADASILHLATHGRFRSDNPWFSALSLGDGFLTLHDLYELRLDAELVVLSGCSTGSGVVWGGNEFVGLMRGLLQAGVRAAVLSLWDVDDAIAREFMVEFYGRATRGEGLALALRDTQASIRERHPHPCHWAPFVLIGRYGALDEGKNFGTGAISAPPAAP